jgi:hypothetical protein
MEIPEEAFTEIISELERQPLEINKYRNKSGIGRSQAFGVVNKRCIPPDYSRQCWLRPVLYKYLLDFGDKYVKDISWNAITVNQGYKALPHRDKQNGGESFLVAFGDFSGGCLRIHEGDLSGVHDIRYKPIQTDFSKVLHSVDDFEGNRYSLVYYRYNLRGVELPPPSVRFVPDYGFQFFRGNEPITIKYGLPHPKRIKNFLPLDEEDL